MQNEIHQNLKLTKNYINFKTGNNVLNPNDDLRTIPPMFNDSLIYDPKSTTKDWLIEYFDDETILIDIFNYQIETKKEHQTNHLSKTLNSIGKILCFEYFETLICGGSQQCSEGFIDNYNFPPIDSWFWIGEIREMKVLLAWIPDKYVSLCQEGIDCNPEGCIDWLEEISSSLEKKLNTTQV